MNPEICPNCGAGLPRRARSCPECGADENSGWSESTGTEHLDLPGEKFDYEEFTRREFGGRSPKPPGIHWFWWLTAIALLAAIFLFWIL